LEKDRKKEIKQKEVKRDLSSTIIRSTGVPEGRRNNCSKNRKCTRGETGSAVIQMGLKSWSGERMFKSGESRKEGTQEMRRLDKTGQGGLRSGPTKGEGQQTNKKEPGRPPALSKLEGGKPSLSGDSA